MPQIRAVIFDLDDTLCDYAQARMNAQHRVGLVLQQHGISDVDPFWQRYSEQEPLLFARFAAGELSVAAYRHQRYASVLCHFLSDFEHLPPLLNATYMQEANENVPLFPDVLDTLEQLAKHHTLALLTNGPADGQRSKIQSLKLQNLVHHIFISEEIGHAKPRSEAFWQVTGQLGLGPDQCLMVGDSLEQDHHGARKAGLQAVWLNRQKVVPEEAIPWIASLADLPAHLQTLQR